MNTKAFFDSIRKDLFAGKLKASQVEGINAILAEYNRLCVNDLRKLAYILATAYHETDKSLQPIREYSRGKGRPYGKKLKMSGQPYALPDFIYYGRGLVQLTWYENYVKMGKILNLDLLNNPDLLLTMEVSVKVLFEGMLKGASSFGDFTGVALEHYFTPTKTDWVGARAIVNGKDARDKIAKEAQLFYKALTLQ